MDVIIIEEKLLIIEKNYPKCIENSMENMHTDVRLQRVKKDLLLQRLDHP